MKVLLTTLNAKYIHTNLAIRLLFQLNKAKHEGLKWKEFTIKEDQNAVAAECATFDVVCFSCYIWNISQTLLVAEKIKAINPAVKILLGGPEVSYDWQNVITKKEIDFIITGEGEYPFASFLENFPNTISIPNLVQKGPLGEVVYFQKTENFQLSDYQFIMPYQDDDLTELSRKVLYIETSRGCPYKCEFCLASLDNKVRYVPDEHIRSTLLFMMKNGRVVKFLDRTFNIKRDFTISIFEFILENHRPENVFQFEITADILHPDIIKWLNEKAPEGLFRFEIGIQTVNQKANLAVSRKQNFEKTKSIIQQLRHKIEMHLDLIVGLPLDEWDDIKHSFEEVFRLHPPELQLGFLKFLKGTPMLEKADQHDYIFDPEPPYQIIESKYLSRAELHRIEVLEHALEIYWNKNRARRMLKYATARYSSFDFLMQLGEFFGERADFHIYSIDDVYRILQDFLSAHYSNDSILIELAAIDYYSFFKTRPPVLFLQEIEATEKSSLLNRHFPNQKKSRFVALPVSFDLQNFDDEKGILPERRALVFHFDGQKKAAVHSLF